VRRGDHLHAARHALLRSSTMAEYTPGLIEALQRALEEVVPTNVDEVKVENDTFGEIMIPVNESG
jgi:hypothetical protein